MGKLFFFALAVLLQQTLFGQDIRIFHGEKGESFFLRQNDGLQNLNREKVTIVRGVDGIVTIAIANPNPFFYKYEIKTEDVDIVDDYSNQFGDLVKLITSMPEISNHFKTASGARAASSKFDEYKTALQTLSDEIKTVKKVINNSDQPESPLEAFDEKGHGFRAAVDINYNVLNCNPFLNVKAEVAWHIEAFYFNHKNMKPLCCNSRDGYDVEIVFDKKVP